MPCRDGVKVDTVMIAAHALTDSETLHMSRLCLIQAWYKLSGLLQRHFRKPLTGGRLMNQSDDRAVLYVMQARGPGGPVDD